MHKPIPHPSLTGPLDLRTLMSFLPLSSYRFRQNFSAPETGKVCRLAGFEKLLNGNLDLHDQLLPLQQYYGNKTPPVDGADDIKRYPDSTHCQDFIKVRTNGAERITYGFEFGTTSGSRKMIVCSQSRIYLANLTTENYRLLGDGYGGPYDQSLSVRFSAAVLGDTVVFTNDYDNVMYWNLNDGPSGCDIQSVKKIQSLIDIRVEAASVVVSFGNVIMLMNVVQDGKRYGNRIVTSDLNQGTDFDPAEADSITAFTTLPDSSGEMILAAAPLNGQLIVYTDKAIYVGGATGNADSPFEFVKHYDPSSNNDKSTNRCLRYKNTLVNTGTTHLYLGSDSIYTFTPYRRDPELVDWIHNASGVIYNGITGYGKINKENCIAHVGAFDSSSKNIYISWAEIGSNVPSKMLLLNMDAEFASTVDYGCTCLFNYIPDYRPLFRDWLLQTCSCSEEDLEDLNMARIKEPTPPPHAPCENPPESIWTNQPGTTFGVYSEDWTKLESDATSLCSILGGTFLSELCRECIGEALFIGALSEDWCLKQIGTAYSREICTNASTGEGVSDGDKYTSFEGEYATVGYNSVIRSAPNNFGGRMVEKNVDRFFLELEADDQVYPCVVSFRLGYSFSALDPNSPNCGILWTRPVSRYFKCPLTKTAAQHAADNTRQGMMTEFPIFGTGVFLYFELTIASLANQQNLTGELVPGIGGSGCLGELLWNVRNDSPVGR